MQQLISQFLNDIHHSTWLEFVAVILGIASVIFSRKENILVYPVGMISTGMFVPLYIIHGLYADASVNLYYTIMSIIGWIMWSRKSDGKATLQISASTKKDWRNTFFFFFTCWIILYVLLSQFTNSTVPVADSFTSGAAFTGMWLMNKKKLENWTWWIITNLASIPLNFYKHLVFASFQYVVFLILAVMGYITWRNKLSMQPPKKIVIIGPESTGKSTLCEQLADYHKTEWVSEFARSYLLEIRRPYTYEDLLYIAEEQIIQEDRICASTNSPLVFIDTDMYVMKVWCEYVFKKCHRFILDQIAKRKYDGYLLCNTDLPWVADELREYPDLESREKLFHMYKDLMVNQTTPWIEISGGYDERLQQAINFVRMVSVEG